MSWIISIETSTNICSIALHYQGKLKSSITRQAEKSHSKLLPGLVLETCKKSEISLQDLKAVAVSVGPGSYTGLRIGVSSAKGLCYALSIPVISITSLDSMIEAVKGKDTYNLCPMIDARRWEVYTKLVDHKGNKIWSEQAKILEENMFQTVPNTTYIFGNGMNKFKEIANQNNLIFVENIFPNASNMGMLAYKKYVLEAFEDLAYFEPNYLKEWQAFTDPKKQ